ncbi:hypothetical protein EKD16_04680 [Streptomonospora litoralis]|uniref:Uncharacterized protein n=1 Tax=Streptomonospora litoralis TaxID=2498135 RepID=A0A4P6PXD9_9ACTN|nr:hypothetical protein EKD16_04680 [Streptomonospora litoralis]
MGWARAHRTGCSPVAAADEAARALRGDACAQRAGCPPVTAADGAGRVRCAALWSAGGGWSCLESGGDGGGGLSLRSPGRVPAGDGGRRGRRRQQRGRAFGGRRWSAAPAAGGRVPGAPPGCRRGPDAGLPAAVMQPDRGHEMHVGAASSASAPPRGAALAPSFRDTKQHGVVCPPMPEFPAGLPPRCGGDGARGAPNGAKTAPGATFRAPRGRRTRRRRPHNGHRAPKVHPIGRRRSRRRHTGAMSAVSSPPAPDPARHRAVRAPATAPRRAGPSAGAGPAGTRRHHAGQPASVGPLCRSIRR